MTAVGVAPSRVILAQAPAPAQDRGTDSSIVTFLSTEVARQMKSLDVPGAVLTVVRDGRVIMNAAFGNSTVTPPAAVDAERTAFRIASVTKVFTALAVLRLVESGRLDLQADVRSTLRDIPIRGDVNGPLTLHQLLTHTAGFDERTLGYFNPPGQAPEPLATHLARAMPERSRQGRDIPG
jgi:CubicO group peptidase (beta-lactamase class C family)